MSYTITSEKEVREFITFKTKEYLKFYTQSGLEIIKDDLSSLGTLGNGLVKLMKNKPNKLSFIKERTVAIIPLIAAAVPLSYSYVSYLNRESLSLWNILNEKILPLSVAAISIGQVALAIDTYTTKNIIKLLEEGKKLDPVICSKYTETNPLVDANSLQSFNKAVSFSSKVVFLYALIPPIAAGHLACLPVILYKNNKVYRKLKRELRIKYETFKEIDSGIWIQNHTLENLLGAEDSKFPLITDSVKFAKEELIKKYKNKVKGIEPVENKIVHPRIKRVVVKTKAHKILV